MRKVIILSILMLVCKAGQAQFDLSINPISILFSSLDLSGEYGIIEDVGLEASLGYDFGKYDLGDVTVKNNGVGIRLIGKYYFKPRRSISRWNLGPYIKYATWTGSYDDGVDAGNLTNTRFAVGLYTGYKWVSRRNIVFELGFGIGRAFLNKYTTDNDSINLDDVPGFNVDLTGKLGLGYRFGSK